MTTLNKINIGIVGVTTGAMIAAIAVSASAVGIIVATIIGLCALSGVISVVGSNNKAPMVLLVTSTIATLYKLSYGVVGVLTNSGHANGGVIVWQTILAGLLFVQVFFWVKWNKQAGGKFATEMFNGKRTWIALSIITVLMVAEFGIDITVGDSVMVALENVIMSSLYGIGALLMAFGNIWCFLFFFLSDLSWMHWVIVDILNAESAVMVTMAWATFFEVTAYATLAVTGFLQWRGELKK